MDDPGNNLIINMEAYYNHESIFLSGTMKTVYQAECSYCLEPFEKITRHSFHDELSLHCPGGGNEEKTVVIEDLEESFPIKGDTIDLGEYFRQLFEVSKGLNNLCHKECLGICAICGKNRNKNRCSCEKENIDPRFSVLKELKDKLNKEDSRRS